MAAVRAMPLRFTPTGVGTIVASPQRSPRWTVHPHGRGDNRRARRRSHGLPGSPPRAWGQWLHASHVHYSSRFTPTGVGTMSCGCPAMAACEVHPHGRGDNSEVRMEWLEDFGSPPRAWGQYLRLRHSNAIRLQKQASKSCSASGRYSYQKEPLYLYELTICGSATP